MKTRREFLAGLAALPFLAKLELPVPKRKLPTMRALQAIADNFLAPKIANDVSFHAPSCSDFRTKAYPHPAKPGWQFVTTWTYQGFRRAFSSASIDPADFKTNDVASIVDMIDVVRQNMTLAAIDFMEQEGATEKHEGNSAEAVSQYRVSRRGGMMKPGERVRIGKPPGAGPWLGDDTEKKVHKIQEGSEGVVRAEQSGELVHVEFDCLKGFLIVCNIVFLEPITPSNKVCVCMTSQLVWGGCLCGAMQVERKKS